MNAIGYAILVQIISTLFIDWHTNRELIKNGLIKVLFPLLLALATLLIMWR